MLLELSAASQQVGLKINIVNTQFMTKLVFNCNISLEGKEIQHVMSFKYLGHELTWTAFEELKHIFKAAIPVCLKHKVFYQCILQVLTSETLT